ncbi:MAG TPA: GNAT family N-acetyltransferase [Flavitalea sp.]|nr:GNAT family N-acetyltransferase [Flavitalea sp.]
MQDITIRTIMPGDNASLAAIIRNTLAEFGANHPGTVYYDPTTDALYDLFQLKGSIYYVAESSGTIAGGGGIYPTKGLPEGTCELVKMYLLPVARGKGLGKKLIDQCLDFAKDEGYSQVYIESMPELKKALSIYEKFGFRYLDGPVGTTGHYGCSVWMIKRL